MIDRNMNIGLFITLFILIISCHSEDEILYSNNPCANVPLEIISDGEVCNDTEFFLVCESVEVVDLNVLQEEDFDWLPMICNDIGETIKYANALNDAFQIKVSHKDHYINKERTNAGCETSYEHVSYICQSNETALVEFTSSIFGSNLTRIKLFRQINMVKDGIVGKPKLYFTLGQPRINTNVHNFFMYVNVEDEYENRSQKFHENLTLNEKDFENVYEFFIRETYWAEPHMSIYINKDDGVLGFKKDNMFWLKED